MPVSAALRAKPFYPPAIQAPANPLSTLPFLYLAVQNPLRTLPRSTYTTPVTLHHPTRSRTVAWICDPQLIENLLVDKQGRFHKHNFEERVLGPAIGDGLLTARGDHWRWQRRTLAPLFRPSEIAAYVPRMAAVARDMTGRWRETARAQGTATFRAAFDREMVDVTFRIISATMLAGGEPAEAETIKRAGDDYLRPSSWEVAFAILQMPRWLWHPAKGRMGRSARRMREAITQIVERHASAPDAANESGDLLARLLAARDPETGQAMGRDLVIDNLLTLLTAGHETTARALTWTAYLISQAPEWQETARAEVLDVVGDAAISAGHLDRLDVVERILKESMRLYPPAAVLARTPKAPTELGGIAYKPGDQLVVPIWSLHRHEALWDDPGRFDPDRFLPEREAAMARLQFMPFGAGPRVCIGSGFAMAEAKVLLAEMLRSASFSFAGDRPPEPISRVTLRPRHGMAMDVRLAD
jgi:cytochrome P450